MTQIRTGPITEWL